MPSSNPLTVTSVQTAAYGGELADANANANEDGSYTVPAGGQVKLEYATAPTTWTTTRTVGAA